MIKSTNQGKRFQDFHRFSWSYVGPKFTLHPCTAVSSMASLAPKSSVKSDPQYFLSLYTIWLPHNQLWVTVSIEGAVSQTWYKSLHFWYLIWPEGHWKEIRSPLGHSSQRWSKDPSQKLTSQPCLEFQILKVVNKVLKVSWRERFSVWLTRELSYCQIGSEVYI